MAAMRRLGSVLALVGLIAMACGDSGADATTTRAVVGGATTTPGTTRATTTVSIVGQASTTQTAVEAATTTARETAVPKAIALPDGGRLVIVAGNGVPGVARADAPAVEASLNLPYALAWDPDGNLYIGQDFRISRVDAVTGILSAYAGTGNPGYSGDGGLATEAELGRTQEIAFDAEGNMYFAEWAGHTIRRVDTDGIISTVVGNGTVGSSPDGTPATGASLRRPYGVAFDAAGVLYFSDGDNHRVRRIAANGTLEAVAGTGEAGEEGDGGLAVEATLRSPRGLTFDATGSLYIGSKSTGVVRVVDASSSISIFSEVGATNIAIGEDGTAYLADYVAGEVVAIASDGTARTALATLSGDTRVTFSYVAVGPDGNVYVTDDRSSYRIYRYEP